jgi:hypothetical protein
MDGFFDCDDQGCFNHPLCKGEGTGASTGGATGGATGSTTGSNTGSSTGTATSGACASASPPALCDLKTADVTLEIQFDYAELMEFLGFCDCGLNFVGTGASTGVVDDSNPLLGVRVEFLGDWQQVPFNATGTTSTTTTTTWNPFGGGCPPSGQLVECDYVMTDTMWMGAPTAYHDFFFDVNTDPPTQMPHWVVHEFPNSFIPQPSASQARQYYITDLWADYDHAFPIVTETFLESYAGTFDEVSNEITVVFGK